MNTELAANCLLCDLLHRAEAAERREEEMRKTVINRLFGIIAPLVDDATWDDAHAKRIGRTFHPEK